MRNMQSKNSGQNIKYNLHKRPEIRDDLDSRKQEEQNFKGDDITHNAKDHHNKHPKKKK